MASFENSAELAVGNVFGSNVANVLLILGVAALIGLEKYSYEVSVLFFGEKKMRCLVCVCALTCCGLRKFEGPLLYIFLRDQYWLLVSRI